MKNSASDRRIALSVTVFVCLSATLARAAAGADERGSTPADTTPHSARVAASAVSLSTDDRTTRIGFDGALRWTPLEPAPDRAGPMAIPPRRLPFAIELRLGGVEQSGLHGASGALRSSLRARLDLDPAETWLGLGAGDGLANAPDQGRLNLGAGLWMHARSLEIETALIGGRVTLPGGFVRSIRHTLSDRGLDSTYLADPEPGPERNALWTTGQTTLRWRRGRAEFATIAALTVGPYTRPRRWAQVTARFQLTPRVAFSLASGQRAPSSLAFDPGAARRTQVGFEVTPWGRTAAVSTPGAAPLFRAETRKWSATSLGEGRVALHVECPYVKHLEVRGDFTDWEPVAMKRIGGNWWELVASIEPGLRLIQVRTEGGEWVAPAGLPLNATAGGEPCGTLLVQ